MSNYFSQGFGLLNSNLKFYLIAALFMVGAEALQANFSNEQINVIAGVIGVFIWILYFAYSFSVYKFLLLRLEKKEVSNKMLVQETLKQLKRLILPGVVIVILGALVFLVSVGIFAALGMDLNKVYSDQLFILSFTMLLGLIYTLLLFLPIYFVIEEREFWSSTKKSVAFSIKHLKFIFVVFIINFLTAYLPTALNLQGSILSTSYIISTYLTLGIAATTLIYYRSHNTQTF